MTYTAAQNATLSFTTAAPLAANLSSTDITAQITGYTGTDGVTTINSSDSRARLYRASVTTDGSGAITSGFISVQLFATTTPDTSTGPNGRFNLIQVGGPATAVVSNDRCITIGPGVGAGASANACLARGVISDSSAANATSGAWGVIPVPSVIGVSPPLGSFSGSTLVTVTGTNLIGATAVSFGGTPGTNIVVLGPTSLTVLSPPESAGVVDVTVTTPGGTSAITPADQFDYAYAAPALSSWALLLLAAGLALLACRALFGRSAP